jgi:RHS repeat-associated protein
LAPHNPGSLNGGFDVVFGHSTPAYFSLGQARGITLAYNSATVRPTPVIFLDVSNVPGYSPTSYSVQVRRNNTVLDLLNGTNVVYYTPATTQPVRLAVAFDAQTNGLGTGWHDVTVTVTSHLSSGPQSNTVPTRVLVLDRTTSPFGKGVDLAGVQRAYTMPGSYSVLVTQGDGSAVYFQNQGECQGCTTFINPAGEASTLSKVTDPTFGPIYRRRYTDGPVVDFRNDGRILRSMGRFGDTTRFTWTDTLLTQIQDPMGKTLTLSYLAGKLQTVTDPAGRVTTYSIDASGRLYRVADPDNGATNLAYDANNLLTSVTDRAGAVTSFTYDALRRVDTTYAPTIKIHTGANVRPRTIVTAPERIVWQPGTKGDSAANAKLAVRPDTLFAIAIGPNGATTKTALDRFGSPTRVIGPYGEARTIARDTLGRVLVTTDPNGHIMRRSYGCCGFLYTLTQMKDSTTGRTVTYGYTNSAVGILLTGMSGDVTQQTFVYHTGTNGRVGALDSVLGENRAILYSVHRPDALGRDTLISDGGSRQTRISYDATWGNVREHRTPDGGLTRYHYDAAGRVDSAWVPQSGQFTYQYDALNRRTQLKNALGQVTQYVYGPTTLNRLVDPKGQVYKFAYNALGLLTARHDLADSLKADSLFYDEAGNVRTARTRRGDLITMTYDLLGRLVSRAGPDFPVDSFKYDPAGRWMVAWNVNQRDSSAFDQAGRLAATRQAMLGGVAYQMSYTYDIRDRLRTRSAPTGGNQAKLVYNSPGGGLDTLCAAGACVAFRRSGEQPLIDTATYNPGLGGSWKRLRFHDASTHLVGRDSFTVVGLDTLFGGRWWYDSIGRLTYEDASAAGTRKWRYYEQDALGRLVDACDRPEGTLTCTNEYGGVSGHPNWGGGPKPYAYDTAGNRTDPSANPTIGPGNRVLGFRGYTLAYDANGSVVSKTGNGVSYTYTWDALGRLTEVRNGGLVIALYKYDALDRRVAWTALDGTTERYVYDGDHVAMDVTGSHAVKTEYGYQPGVDRLFALRRAQAPIWTGIAVTDPVAGTVRGIANLSGGALRKRYELTAWGKVSDDTGAVTRYRMAGREYDQATRLYYMRARYYDPELGRFLSEDPQGPSDGLNLYAYAGNDPVNFTDPSGLEIVTIRGCLFNIVESQVTVGESVSYEPEVTVTFLGCVGNGRDETGGPGAGWTPTGATLAEVLKLWQEGSSAGGAAPGGQPTPQPKPKPQGPSCGAAFGQLGVNLALDATGAALARKAARLAREAYRLQVKAQYLSRAGRYVGDGQSYWAGVRGAQADLVEAQAGAAVAQFANAAENIPGALERGGGFWGAFRTVTEFLPWGGSVWAGIDVIGACF